jgi:hypothetical protein
MGVEKVTSTERSETSAIKCYSRVDRFLIWFWGPFSPWVSSTRQDSDQGILSWSNETSSYGCQERQIRCLEVKPMDVPCWQCSRAHIVINPSVLGETRDNSHCTTSLVALSSTSGLFLFPKLKMSLKCRHFENSLAYLHSIPNEAFQKWFEGWK